MPAARIVAAGRPAAGEEQSVAAGRPVHLRHHDANEHAINPNGKVPAIVDTEGPGGKEVRVFDSTAIPDLPRGKDREAHGRARGPPGVAVMAALDWLRSWGWLDRASRVLKGADNPLAPYPHLKRLFQTVDARPARHRDCRQQSGCASSRSRLPCKPQRAGKDGMGPFPIAEGKQRQ